MKEFVKRLLQKYGYKMSRIEQADFPGNISYSQCGEDILVDYIFELRNIKQPTYLDIGANQPVTLNNTFKFYRKGSNGVNVEPNKGLLNQFKQIRPRDINVNAGISPVKAELEFYEFNDHTLSTFDKAEADTCVAMGHRLKQINTIQTYTIWEILEQHYNGSFPDFLSIVVEGLYFDIIKSTDFDRGRPKVICAETAEYSPVGAGEKRLEYMAHFESLGYFLYADTNLNSIYVDRKFWFI